MAARRWDRLSEGSRRREAPRAALVFLHAVSSPPPPRDPHRAPTPAHEHPAHAHAPPLRCTTLAPRLLAFCRRRALESVFFSWLRKVRPRSQSQSRPRSPYRRVDHRPSGGTLAAALAATGAAFVAALPSLTPFGSLACAGILLRDAQGRGGPAARPPPRRRPPGRFSPAAPAPQPLTLPLPSLTHPFPSISTLTTPSPSLLRASRHPNPLQPRTSLHPWSCLGYGMV